MNRLPSAILLFLLVLHGLASSADAKLSAELESALAAAAKAGATPGGEAYTKTVQSVLWQAVREGNACFAKRGPGILAQGFKCVLIIGKDGKLKWIIRDAHDVLTACFLSKLLHLTFPPPPADNWPLVWGVTLHTS